MIVPLALDNVKIDSTKCCFYPHRLCLPVKRMSLKSKLIFIVSFLFLIIILFCALTGLYFHLPTYVESKVIPEIAKKAGITDFACEVRGIGFTGADLGSLRIGDDEYPALSVASIRIDYSLKELYKKHIRRVIFCGSKLYCEFKNGEFVISGFDLKKYLTQLQSKTTPSPIDKLQPVSIERFEIRNAIVICKWRGKKIRLPFELEIVPENRDWNSLDCALQLYPRGNKIAFVGNIDLIKKKIFLKFDASAIHLDRFDDFTKLIPGLILSGEADIKGKADLRFGPFKISSVFASCEFQNAEFSYHNIKLRNLQHPERSPLPFRIEINGHEGEEWKISGSSVSVVSPIHLNVSDADCSLKITQNSVESSGNFMIAIEQFKGQRTIPVKVLEPLCLQGNYFAQLAMNGEWDFRVTNTPLDKSACTSKNCKFKINTFDITSRVPQFYIFGKGKKAQGAAKYKVIIPDVHATAKSTTIKISSVSLKGKAGFHNVLRFDGTVKFTGADIANSILKTKVNEIDGMLPFQWPCKGLGKKGKVLVKTIKWRNLNLGSVTVSVRQKRSGVIFASNIDLGQFLPSENGVTFNGKLILNGDLFFGDTGMKSSLNSKLNNANVIQKEKEFAVEGINVDLFLPNLFKMRSAPRQRLSFEKASLGELSMNDGNIEFQIESTESFFIEKSSFYWCDGYVNTQAFRISPGVEDYDLILYCDRVNLAMVLEQFGLASAEGKGTVNGRIPLRFKNGKLRFGDGFLFSTPGDGGTIHVTGTEILTAGIPPNTPQYNQIELAREALKDFDYKWAKLKLISEGEDLLLRLEFDGKPSRPLPFVYKKEYGGFVRVEADSKGSLFHGIRLDVNFRLPIDKILHYKDIFHMMQ